MNRFSSFIIGLVVAFAIPWIVMVVMPYSVLGRLAPVAFDPDVDQREGVYPAGRPGIVEHGQAVYRREGCVNCHTQVIRPTYAGMDSFKTAFGRGGDESGAAQAVHTRETNPYDYLGQDVALIGLVRNGPDLVNVGLRRTDPAWHHAHLFDPRAVHGWSTMPSFRHLYKKRLVQGQPSADALALEGEHAPEEGYEIVPTYDARALVGYLMSLKTEETIPSVLSGKGGESDGSSSGAEGTEG